MQAVRVIEPERPSWLTPELFPFRSRFIDLDGVRIHYVDEGSGPTLLFLAGAPNWSFFYRRFIDGLRDQFRCIAVDYPGFGLSGVHPRQSPTVPNLADFVEKFIQLLDLRDIILVAGDAGGPIGLGVAARQPDRFAGLVLAGTFGWPLTSYPKVRRMLRLSGSPAARILQEQFNLLMNYTARTFPMSAAERRAGALHQRGCATQSRPVASRPCGQ